MQETELKFQVPQAARAGLRRAVDTAAAQTTRLQAVYADTPDHHLAAAGLALRLRKEGRHWVQTLKGRGDGLMQRLEHEVLLPPQRGQPAIDPALHDGTAAGLALRAALQAGGAAAELQPLYRTDIQRLHRMLRHGGARIEVAYDVGHIFAGDARLAVNEVEFELKRGAPQALTELAARWALRHSLWWDVRTKSERGFRLAMGLEQVPATKAMPVVFGRGFGLADAWRRILQSTLAQALPNLAELAGGDALPEHLHQLRVALRRQRTALELFAEWGPDAATAQALEREWREIFNRLGDARDADVLADTWLPRLQAAGAPAPHLPASRVDSAQDPAAVLRDPVVTVLLLRTLALALPMTAPATAAPATDTAGGERTGKAPPTLEQAARQLLRRAWRKARADCAAFPDSEPPQRHRARKRLKRLRYAVEFLLPTLPAKPARRLQRALSVALEALGQNNDLQVAEAHFAAAAERDRQPHDWFARGWLAAQRAPMLQRAQRALDRLGKAPRPWRR